MSTLDHYESLRDRANRLAADLTSLCARVEPLLTIIETKETALKAAVAEMEAAERAAARPVIEFSILTPPGGPVEQEPAPPGWNVLSGRAAIVQPAPGAAERCEERGDGR